MGHKEPQTIANVMRQLQRSELVIPAIQREFEWKTSQIVTLFDSVLRGYPIGSFLSWRVETETVREFKFYGVMRDYSAFDNRHNPKVDIPTDRQVTAILDGQQRLTALNIGLRGTYAYRTKGGHSTKAWNYPKRRLFLDVTNVEPDRELGLQHHFRFLTDKEFTRSKVDPTKTWVPVSDIYDASKINHLMSLLARYNIGNNEAATIMISELWQAIHETPILHFYEEEDQDIERVLDIFVRVNSQGTVLSYAALLMSMAVAQWKDKDARAEINELVDELNSTGQGFNFGLDTVLKAGLVLTEVGDFGFKVKNFTSDNTRKLEAEWESISRSLKIAAELLCDFGLSEANLTAKSVLIPVAYYVHRRALPPEYRVSDRRSDREDRALLRNWVLRSLVVPGVWGSGLDTLLRALRDVIRLEGAQSFPADAIERAMALRGKSLQITDALVDDILDLKYGAGRTWAILALIFDHVDTRMQYHVDHVFPRSLLDGRALRGAETGLSSSTLSDATIAEMVARRDLLPNLELLPGPENIAKSNIMPALWLSEHYPDPASRINYLQLNALPEDLPGDASEFLQFFEARRTLLAERIKSKLGDGPAIVA